MELETKEIIQHAKASEDHMRVAIAVGRAYYELLKTLIVEFAQEFEKKIMDNGWDKDGEFDNYLKNNPFGRYAGMSYRQNHWPKEVCVCMETDKNNGRDFWVGVVLTKDGTKNENSKNIWNRLIDNFRNTAWSENYPPWWAGCRRLPKYSDFTNMDTLIALYKKDDIISTIYEEFTQLRDKLNEIFPPPSVK